MTYQQRKEVAVRAAYAAGQVLRECLLHPLDISSKGSANDLVTNADRAAESAIMEVIRAVYPDDVILSEETPGVELTGAGWVIDPLDGTTNYSRGYPLFGPSIAWMEAENRAGVGVVYNPLLDELYWAVRGEGAWCNDRRLQVASTSTLERAFVTSGTPYVVRQNPALVLDPWNRMITQVLALREDGSAALDLCHVAAGRTDAHFEVNLKPWDVAAGTLIVAEAGGKTTTYRGEPFTLYRSSYISSNGAIHDALVAQLKELG